MKKLAKKMLHSGLPTPRFMYPLLRFQYYMFLRAGDAWRLLLKWFVKEPTFRAFAHSIGNNLRFERIPYIRGKGKIIIGSQVHISGLIGLYFSSHAPEAPEFSIGDGTFIGDDTTFSMAKGISIGNDCLISGGCVFQDNDGHPLDAKERKAGNHVSQDEVHQVVIEDNVWIGARVTVLKGVTIGENSVVGTGAIVTEDIPAGSLAVGNPAKVIKKLSKVEL